MSPEYGATMGFFPVDEVTLEYMRLTGRDPKKLKKIEASGAETATAKADVCRCCNQCPCFDSLVPGGTSGRTSSGRPTTTTRPTRATSAAPPH